MWLELKIKDYKCPSCQKEYGDKITFEEYDGEDIWDDYQMTCECGAVIQIDVECDVSVKLIRPPIVEDSVLPDVVGDNQLPLFNTPSV